MSGHSVQADFPRHRDQHHPHANSHGGMRVTIILDREDWTPEAIDKRLAEVRKTIDRYIEARRR